MKVSGTGAAVGAVVGCVARAAVVFLNVIAHGGGQGPIAAFVLPSATIGLLVGAMAGAVGRPLLGAAVGAVLSGVVFELFMFACASLIGNFNQKAGVDFFSQTLVYGLEMAVAGAIAGGVGGLFGRATAGTNHPSATAPSRLGEGEEKQIRRKEGQE